MLIQNSLVTLANIKQGLDIISSGLCWLGFWIWLCFATPIIGKVIIAYVNGREE